MIWLFLQLIIGLALILLGANFLVDGSSSIARKSGISEFVVGMTIVGIGTSTPEMVVSFISSINGSSDIAVGNIVGSNLANTFLILGLVSAIAPIALTKTNLRQDIPFALAASLILFILASDKTLFGGVSNTLSRWDGAIFLLCFVIFMVVSFKTAKKPEEFLSETEHEKPQKTIKTYLAVIFIIGGLAGLIFGGQLFVKSGSAIASHYGIPDAFIGITIMAIGTSLPELAASMVAAIKKRGQMALGNIIGSNIANIFLILGGSALIHPLTMTNITLVDMSLLLFTSVAIALCAVCFKKKVIDRWEGILFVIIYLAYMFWLIYNL